MKKLLLIILLLLTSCGNSIPKLKNISIETDAHIQPAFDSGMYNYIIAPIKDEIVEINLECKTDCKVFINDALVDDMNKIKIDLPEYGSNIVEIKIQNSNSSNLYKFDFYKSIKVLPISYKNNTIRFKDNNNKTITDSLTNLTWAKDAGVSPRVNWEKAFEFIEKLNKNKYCGHDDWRLPNMLELKTLMDYETDKPAEALEKSGFDNVQNDYWSSTTFMYKNDDAWVQIFTNAHMPNCRPKIKFFHVLPVRGKSAVMQTGADHLENYKFVLNEDGASPFGIKEPSPRFFNNKDGTLIDNMTGLMWTKNADIGGMVNFNEAVSLLKEFNSKNNNNNCGYTDWRLPTVNELLTLANYGVKDGAKRLSEIQPGFENAGFMYWTSTPYSYDPEKWGWSVMLQNGLAGELNKTLKIYVMFVRTDS